MPKEKFAKLPVCCDWQHGVSGLSWTYPTPGGHRALRWPSTLGAVPPNENYDSWTYFSDFQMADAEADLVEDDDAPANDESVMNGGNPLLMVL